MPANMKSAHIVVIDQSINGYLSLLEAATAGGHEVILLSGKGDGFLELGQAIAGRSDIQNIHLFSHGSEGSIQLGQAQLNNNNLNKYADVLETIKFSLVEGGDLLIYGCNVAGSEEGKQFVAALSEVLNADMAASDDLTGHRYLGGDWELEYQHGDISPVGDWLWSVRSEFMQTLGSTVVLNSSWLMNNTDDWIYSDNQSDGDLSGTPDSIYIDIESQNPQLTYPVEFTIESLSNTPFNLDSITVRPFDTSNPYYLEILPDGNEGGKVVVPVIENQSNETVIISVDLNSITSFTVRFLDQGVTQGPPINLDFLNFSTSDAPVNNDPLFIDYGPFSIAENSANGSVVGDINANDGDGGADDANVTYSIVSGNPDLDLDDNSAFSIDINTGIITVNDTDDIDFEIATSHTLTISATDQNSAMTTQSVTINVTDDEGDNPPMLNTGDMAVLGWNALNDTITFTTLVDLPAGTVIKFTDKGWDQSTNAFTTTSTGDGVITWTVGSPINAGSVFELFMGGSDEVTTLINKTANVDLTADIVSSSFTVTDPMNLAGDSVFIYQGDDSNPFFIFGMNNSGGTVDSTNWNTSIVATLRDSMLPNSTGSQNTLTNGANAIGLPGGASQLDNVQYTGPTGIADKATWLARIADVGNWTGDNTGTVSTSAGINVQIGVANEAPVFTTSNKASVAENTTAVTTLVATDADGDVLTYSLTGGADQALFTLDTKSGALSFKSAPDFEAPADSNGDNTYTVEVTASDGQGGTTPLTLTVTVTDVNEAPTLTGATKVSVAENTTGVLYTATASDPENDALTYTLSGTDAALFTLDANSGALSFKSAPDFEAPADAGGNNIYDVILTANDGSLSSSPQALAITVTNVNEAPVFVTSSKANVAENTTAVTTLLATDADG
ncbi:DUF4347 domain-containing protein, partial [Vreelandella boliviensis]|uniref:DUF4347 domain-containing protein n=1 Tax=Vreelandella boliviensis TaxID=223527 RepID=UPI001B8C7FF5